MASLSKSKIIANRQCPKRLWLQINRPDLIQISAETQSRFDAGNKVGDVARQNHPEGVFVDTLNRKTALALTKKALDEHQVIFEAAFFEDDILIRADLIFPENDQYRLVEVKSSTSVKDYHIEDVSVQSWVMEKAGYPPSSVALAYINNEFIYEGNGNYQGLFAEADLSNEVKQMLPDVQSWVESAKKTLASKSEPAIAPGDQCNHPQLADVVAKSKRWFYQIFPGAKFNESDYVWKWPTGEMLYFRYGAHEGDYWNYHGHEYPWLGFEELTNWRNLSFYEAMHSTCRSSRPGMPRMVRATCNPFGIGHASVKERFQIGSVPAGKIIRQEGSLPRVRIHSTIYENTHLLKNDPNYLMSLESLSDPNRRRAWLEGDWDIHVGSFLEGVWQPSKHIIEPFAIPPSWKVWRSMDWGYARPYAIYWFALSNDGVYYLWRELYGYGDKENTGTREDATVVADKIKKIETHDERLGYEYRLNLADPSIFSKIGAERSIGQIFRDKGVKWTEAYNAPRSRVNGAQEIIRLLAEERLKVFSTCKHWLRTIPQLPPDSLNPEDVDTDAEDHAWDATRYGVMRARRIE